MDYNKSGYDKHCGRKDNVADNASIHPVQEVVDVTTKPTKTTFIFIHQISTTQGRYSEGQEYPEAE